MQGAGSSDQPHPSWQAWSHNSLRMQGAGSSDQADQSRPQWYSSPIRGVGREQGNQPRGAGIIAICELDAVDHVCICHKREGASSFPRSSFPKGGLNVNENVIECATREWQEETGISRTRLLVHEGATVDDARWGCRYFVAYCELWMYGTGVDEPDYDCKSWKPPYEDPLDRDPIVEAEWVPVKQVLQNKYRRLSAHRKRYLSDALELLKTDGNFMSFDVFDDPK